MSSRLRKNPTTDAEEAQLGDIGRRVERSREELTSGRGRYERRLGASVGRSAAQGSLRSVVEVFQAETYPDLPALRADIRAGRRPAPELTRLGQQIAEIERDRSTLRAKIGREDSPNQNDVKLLISLTEDLGKLYEAQAAEAKAALALASPPESVERRRYSFLKGIRLVLHDALVEAAPVVDHLQMELSEPGMAPPRRGEHRVAGELDERDAAEMAAVAVDLRSTAEDAAAKLQSFLVSVANEDSAKPQSERLSEDEFRGISEAADWLLLASKSLGMVQMAQFDGVSDTVLKFFRDLLSEEGVEEEQEITDESMFAALVKGVRGISRAWHRIAHVTSFGGTKYVEGATEIPKTSVGFKQNPGGKMPRCCSDI